MVEGIRMTQYVPSRSRRELVEVRLLKGGIYFVRRLLMKQSTIVMLFMCMDEASL
jgi:hypothetical protein